MSGKSGCKPCSSGYGRDSPLYDSLHRSKMPLHFGIRDQRPLTRLGKHSLSRTERFWTEVLETGSCDAALATAGKSTLRFRYGETWDLCFEWLTGIVNCWNNGSQFAGHVKATTKYTTLLQRPSSSDGIPDLEFTFVTDNIPPSLGFLPHPTYWDHMLFHVSPLKFHSHDCQLGVSVHGSRYRGVFLTHHTHHSPNEKFRLGIKHWARKNLTFDDQYMGLFCH